jgi:hypothetical protein
MYIWNVNDRFHSAILIRPLMVAEAFCRLHNDKIMINLKNFLRLKSLDVVPDAIIDGALVFIVD